MLDVHQRFKAVQLTSLWLIMIIISFLSYRMKCSENSKSDRSLAQCKSGPAYTNIPILAYFLTKRGNKSPTDEKYITIIAKNILTTYNTLQNLLDRRAHDQVRSISMEEIWGCVSHHHAWDALQKRKKNTK